MYFFVFLTQLYLRKYIKKSTKPLFFVSKFFFHFQIKYKFSVFYQLLYFWNVFADVSKQQNAQTRKTVTNVAQKQKIVWPRKLAQMLSIHRAKKLWSPIFDICFQIWILLQSFLIGRLPVAIPTVLTIRLYGFVRNVLLYHLCKRG